MFRHSNITWKLFSIPNSFSRMLQSCCLGRLPAFLLVPVSIRCVIRQIHHAATETDHSWSDLFSQSLQIPWSISPLHCRRNPWFRNRCSFNSSIKLQSRCTTLPHLIYFRCRWSVHFFFFSCELKHCFVRIQIWVFNYNVFRAKLIQIAVDSCWVLFW